MSQQIEDNSIKQKIAQVLEIMKQHPIISRTLLQRKMKITSTAAQALLDTVNNLQQKRT
jgi:hypothetical protein